MSRKSGENSTRVIFSRDEDFFRIFPFFHWRASDDDDDDNNSVADVRGEELILTFYY